MKEKIYKKIFKYLFYYFINHTYYNELQRFRGGVYHFDEIIKGVDKL